MSLPTISDIHNAQARPIWNVLCFPFVSTIGLLYRSLRAFVGPCLRVLTLRLANIVHRKLCCCCGWPYEDKNFIGARALGDHSASDSSNLSAAVMEQETDWVRAHELSSFGGKRPQLFEGGIEPDDLCQGAVGDCWLVAALACASEYPDCIRNVFRTKEYNPRGM